jgi:hypothetical protein
VLVVAGIVVTSLVLAAVVAGLGPSGQVVSGTGHVLDRIAQAVTQPLGAGHVDGPAASTVSSFDERMAHGSDRLRSAFWWLSCRYGATSAFALTRTLLIRGQPPYAYTAHPLDLVAT